MGKRASCYEIALDAETLDLTIGYSDETEVNISLQDFGDTIQSRLALHGLKQKLGDSTAGFGTVLDEIGPDQALIWAKDNQTRVITNLMAGEWSTRGEGAIRVTDLHEALVDVYGQPIDVVIAKLEGMGKEEKASLRSVPLIAEALLKIKAKRAEARADKARLAAQESGELPSLF
jgi:hypothetical protein